MRIEIEQAVCFDGEEMVRQRRLTGLSQSEFAKAAGWSQQYQGRLENPGRHCISDDKWLTIQQVVREACQGRGR